MTLAHLGVDEDVSAIAQVVDRAADGLAVDLGQVTMILRVVS
jgi:hypothetical protein